MVARLTPSAQHSDHAAHMLAWYDRHARTLPWRTPPGIGRADPYQVWLSEIMLQQTTVQAVKAYFEAFVSRWPTVEALAAASLESVLQQWAGLGYYSRARNLHACAQAVVAHHGGQFPADEAALLSLPGIGSYTAAAIAAIAFGNRAVVVDGNVERVITRLRRIAAPLPDAKREIRAVADALTPDRRPGDYAQAMMDLGATLCVPRKPRCDVCPVALLCAGKAAGDAESYPRKRPKPVKPSRKGVVFVAIRADGAVLVRTRPPKGLLGGMTELPGSEWTEESRADLPLRAAPLSGPWRAQDMAVRHVFTHFALTLTVYRQEVEGRTLAPTGMRWLARTEIAGEAFPTLYRKVLKAAGL